MVPAMRPEAPAGRLQVSRGADTTDVAGGRRAALLSTRRRTRAVRFAIAAGAWTPELVHASEAEAHRLGVGPLDVLSKADLLHVRLVRKVLPPACGWEDVVAAIWRYQEQP